MTTTRGEQLASELEAAVEDIARELEAIPDELWSQARTTSEHWTVGQTAHHIAEGFLLSDDWIQRSVESGAPVTLDPAVDLPARDALNARCLVEHASETRTDTLRLLRANARRLGDTVRSLGDEQLDSPMLRFGDRERTGSQVAVPLALRHAHQHLESIRGALALATPGKAA